MDPILYEAFDRLLTQISTPQVVRDIESGGSTEPLWQQITESGFADAMIAEEAGGAGLNLSDAFGLFFLCGRHALPLPLAQTIIARRILMEHGIDIPDGPIAISPLPVNHTNEHIECRNVPFGPLAQSVVVPHGGASAHAQDLLLHTANAGCSGTGVHGSLQGHLSWTQPDLETVIEGAFPWLEVAAAITAAQMAGAMDTILNITVKYASERSQFGRPIAKFQAVQQQMSVLAELASASRVGAELGCGTSADGTPNVLAAAVAKARASEAAGTVVSIAHGVHAAMGITEEYDLQIYTRRLIEWRTDYGSAGYWNRRVGDAALSSEAPSTLEFMLPAFFADSAAN